MVIFKRKEDNFTIKWNTKKNTLQLYPNGNVLEETINNFMGEEVKDFFQKEGFKVILRGI